MTNNSNNSINLTLLYWLIIKAYERVLLLGDEAIAQAALDAGLSGMYAYPGTPSTEIMEFIQSSKEASEKNVHREWSSNEKTAMEAALGMSYAVKGRWLR